MGAAGDRRRQPGGVRARRPRASPPRTTAAPGSTRGSTIPWVKGSYAGFLPGQYTKYWGYLKKQEDGVHFAGEHTSTHSQGYLNGGVESGDRAAREVLHALA